LQRKQSQQRQTITQRDAQHLFRRLAAAKERQEEINNNQHRFFFRWGEGAISPEPKKDDGARCCGEGASSLPQRTRDGKTQQSKRELRADIPRKEKRNNNQNGFFFLLGEGAISQSQRKMMARDAVARAPPHCLSARAMGKHNNKPELIFHFHIPTPTSCHHLQS
jgi:hypothetical protein